MIVQRLMNRFPPSSKARQDQSSFAYRAFSVYGDYFDYAYMDGKRIYEDSLLLKKGLGFGHVYQLPLLEADFMTYELSLAGEPIWSYPLLAGTVSSTTYEIARVDAVEDLAWLPPTRLVSQEWIGVEDLTLYTDDRNGTIVSNTIDYPARLTIRIANSTNYYKKTPLRNRRGSGKHLLILVGKDANGSSITEYVDIPDDGFYLSKNVFSEIIEVIPEGFNGDIAIAIGDALNSSDKQITDPYRLCVLEDAEGPLKLELSTYGSTHTAIRYFTFLTAEGKDYRDGAVEITENEEERWEQTLLDVNSQAIVGIDFAINPNTGRLYCLDEDGLVHIYDHEPKVFGSPSLQSDLTLINYLEIIPVQQYAKLNDSLTFFTRFVRIRFPVVGVTIKRVKPSGTTEYLQANKTWAGGVYEWPGTQLPTGLPEDSWQDFSFTDTFDEFGQWEYYCIVRSKFDTTVSYTGVMVDALPAVISLDTGVVDPVGIWFNSNDELTITSTTNGPDGEANSFYTFYEAADRYLADTSNQVLYLREQYDEVSVT